MNDLTEAQKAELMECLQYVKDVGPSPSYMERFLDGDGITWSIDGDDGMGFFWHLNRAFELLGVKSSWDEYEERLGRVADEAKTPKENEWKQ